MEFQIIPINTWINDALLFTPHEFTSGLVKLDPPVSLNVSHPAHPGITPEGVVVDNQHKILRPKFIEDVLLQCGEPIRVKAENS